MKDKVIKEDITVGDLVVPPSNHYASGWQLIQVTKVRVDDIVGRCLEGHQAGVIARFAVRELTYPEPKPGMWLRAPRCERPVYRRVAEVNSDEYLSVKCDLGYWAPHKKRGAIGPQKDGCNLAASGRLSWIPCIAPDGVEDIHPDAKVKNTVLEAFEGFCKDCAYIGGICATHRDGLLAEAKPEAKKQEPWEKIPVRPLLRQIPGWDCCNDDHVYIRGDGFRIEGSVRGAGPWRVHSEAKLGHISLKFDTLDIAVAWVDKYLPED